MGKDKNISGSQLQIHHLKIANVMFSFLPTADGQTPVVNVLECPDEVIFRITPVAGITIHSKNPKCGVSIENNLGKKYILPQDTTFPMSYIAMVDRIDVVPPIIDVEPMGDNVPDSLSTNN